GKLVTGVQTCALPICRLERAKEAEVTTIGILHPGEMGSSVAAAARAGGSRVVWASAGRGEATRKRAEADGLEDVGTLVRLAREKIGRAACRERVYGLE